MLEAFSFGLTRLWFALRDRWSPPSMVLCETEVRPGWRVLDYGCGPGSYSIELARLVGQAGNVYAADMNPRALRHLERVVLAKGLDNVETIQTDCDTGLDAGSVDIVLLYDTYHDLKQPGCVLAELHRVLRPNGILSFSDHHMQHHEILSAVKASGLFRLSHRGEKTYRFHKEASGTVG
jgi:ubiquinone/menaquinone biosynthesis C-methylase UbiE